MSKSRPGTQVYPETSYSAAVLPDLSREEDRRRLTAAGLKAFFKIVERWKVTDEDARELLGGISNGTYYQWKGNPRATRTLDQDELTRISYLIGVYKALNILYSQRLADQWMQLANTNPIFGGRPPLEYVLHGGIPAMETLRRLVDARRGGW
ncbi:MAG TPA: antitoxin Xre-like helix-turn-helix domain-containing protein [Acidobacteriaceae bacterium]|nr:antitoxin Xre-like helix-turn-helix domain-containing protein [Acidobacteriaceae bacterium]